MTTRAEHLAWCKQRALEYVDLGDLTNAVSSMVSDMGKHPGTEASCQAPLAMIGMVNAADGDARRVREWIEGFA